MSASASEGTQGHSIARWAVMFACMCLPMSCDRPIKANPSSYLAFSLDEVDGNATIDTKRFAMVFEGEEYGERTSGDLQVGGSSGPTEVTAGELTGRYEDGSVDSHGVCTVRFRSHSFTISDGGKRLSMRGTDVDIGEAKKTIMVREDGQITVKEE